MSIMELLLAQKGILFGIGLAFLLLTAAVVLLIVSRAKQASVQRARRRARIAAEQRIQPEVVASADPATFAAVSAVPLPGVEARPGPAQPAPTKTVVVGQAKESAQPAQPPTEVTAVDSPMQDMLSSIFGGEEVSARNDTLLSGLAPVELSDLVALSKQVAEQLRR